MSFRSLDDLVDFTVYDVDFQRLMDLARMHVATRFPGLVASGEPSPTWTLLEAVALVADENDFAINRIPRASLDGLLALHDVPRSPGVRPTGAVMFACNDAAGHLIPAGTRLRIRLAGTVPFDLPLTTDSDLVIAFGSTTGTVPVTSSFYTAAANGTPAGTDVIVLDRGIEFVNDVILTAQLSAGADPETEDSRLARAVQRMRRLTSSLDLPEHFEAFALEQPVVLRADVVQRWDGAEVSPGANTGHVTVLVAGTAGAALGTGETSALVAAMNARANVSLVVHVLPPALTTIPVSYHVRRYVEVTDDDVEDAIAVALADYLNPETWPLGKTVEPNELLVVIDGAPGVDTVIELVAPAAPVALAFNALPRVGAVTSVIDPP